MIAKFWQLIQRDPQDLAIDSVGPGRLALFFCFFSLGGACPPPPHEKNEKNKVNLPGPTELIAKPWGSG